MENNDANKFEKYLKLKSEMELLKKRLSEIENEVVQMIQENPDIILSYPELEILKSKIDINRDANRLALMEMKLQAGRISEELNLPGKLGIDGMTNDD